jgi:hypothetical protein
MSDVWADYDHPPRPRVYEKCKQCDNDLVLRHYCASDEVGPTEAIEGWFMDDGYAPDKGFWQMGASIIEALRNEGYIIVKADSQPVD